MFDPRKYILVKQESQKVWRRSSIGSYVLVKVVNGIPQTNKRDLIPLRPKSAVSEGFASLSFLNILILRQMKLYH